MTKGFIALFSVIIITLVLLVVAVSLNFTGFFSRFNIFDTEKKEQSSALAEACLEDARLELALNSTFTGGGGVTLGTDTCSYEVESGGEITISAQAGDAYTYYWAEVDTSDAEIPINSFKECKSLSTCL
ncbi:MAG: hypothetical protein AAB500_02525 [Patescibacteria group bacterium]